MRISELSATGKVSVPTIKYYLREGLLHEGRLTSATQAQYDDTHLARLHLIKALLVPGGLSIATAKAVLAEIDHPSAHIDVMLGAAQHALGDEPPPEVDLSRARQLIADLGWRADACDTVTFGLLQRALDGLDSAEFTVPQGLLDIYAAAIHHIAEQEIALAPTDSPEHAIRYAVLGTVLIEPLLIALRRLAHQDASAARFGDSNKLRVGD